MKTKLIILIIKIILISSFYNNIELLANNIINIINIINLLVIYTFPIYIIPYEEKPLFPYIIFIDSYDLKGIHPINNTIKTFDK